MAENPGADPKHPNEAVTGRRPPVGEMVTTIYEHEKRPGEPPVLIETKQLHLPAEKQPERPVMPANPSEWEVSAHDYLKGKGWEPRGTNARGQMLWVDPKGSVTKGEVYITGELPDEQDTENINRPEQRKKKLKQLVFPASGWDCTTDRAVFRQRARDLECAETGVAELSPLQRIARLERERNELQQIRDDAVKNLLAMTESQGLSDPRAMVDLMRRTVRKIAQDMRPKPEMFEKMGAA